MVQPQITTNRRAANPMRQTAARLELTRQRVRRALRIADEGEPSYGALEDISRDLVAAVRDLARIAVELETYARHVER